MVGEVVAGQGVDAFVVTGEERRGDGDELAVRGGRGNAEGVGGRVLGRRGQHRGNDQYGGDR